MGAESRVRRALFAPERERPSVDEDALCLLIRQKLADGRLPRNSLPRLWGWPADGEACDGCDEVIPKGHFVMEVMSTDVDVPRVLKFHVGCLQVWVREA